MHTAAAQLQGSPTEPAGLVEAPTELAHMQEPSAAAPESAPPTPLEQRQWQRTVQRSVRMAVTAFKDAASRVADATQQGTAVATQLTNSILSERYMPDTELPEVLKEVQGLKLAAVGKLQRQQRQQLQQLSELLISMETAVQDMEAAVGDISSHLTAASAWQHSLPVFHTLSLPESKNIFSQLLDMYSRDVESKQQLVDSYTQLVMSERRGSKRKDGRAGVSVTGDIMSMGVEELRKVLTAAVTMWMVRPCIDDELSDHLLQVLTDEMVGY